VNKHIPELSIIICGKQDEFELNKTLNSLLGQVNSRYVFDLVLSDFRKEYLKELQLKLSDHNFNLHLTEPKGIYSAMNLGLRVSQTKFVLFLNSGDELCPIANLDQLLDNIENRNWGFGSIIKILDGQESIYSFKPYKRFLHRFGIKYVPHPATIMNRKMSIDLGGFDEKYRVAADQKLMMQFGKIQTPVTFNAPIAKFYLNGISSSRANSEIVDDFHDISTEVYGRILDNALVDKYVWKLLTGFRRIYTQMPKFLRSDSN
jgi:glycosyltransferase involved in cell wall biosynthesis